MMADHPKLMEKFCHRAMGANSETIENVKKD